MKNKRKIATTFIIILIVLVVVGGVFAYLTSTDTKTNIFTLGRVKIELTEPNFVQDNAIELRPGDEIAKDPKITNIGKNSAYVYIKVINPIVNLSNGEGPLFSYTINSGWTMLTEVERCGYKATTYYYNTALNPNASTTTLFNTVTLNNYSNDSNPNQILDLYGYAIQSNYLASGSTITSIFTSTFRTDLSDTDDDCNSATDCSNNTLDTTIPVNLRGLARIMAKDAYLDNAKSEFVSYCDGIKFNRTADNNNGKGIYEIASTKNDTYPIYYYRGRVENNNVKFAGFCWKAIRTTDTGGVKLIYNGEPNGSGNCTNTTGYVTTMGAGKYNLNSNSPAYVGYMYGTVYNTSQKPSSDFTNSYIFGNDVTYSNGTYTLTNTISTTGTWSNDRNTIKNYHYTCLNSSSTCSNVYYIYYDSSSEIYYITLTSGKKVEDAIAEMFINTTDSNVKNSVDNWYRNNLTSYTSYIEDTVYCNDRSTSGLGGFNPDGGELSQSLFFGPYIRSFSTYTPTLECSRPLDRFTVSSANGNGALTYPVGLITSDEVMYAGAKYNLSNNCSYLNNANEYWFLSPWYFSSSSQMMYFNSSNRFDFQVTTNGGGYRPVISLKSTVVVESGDGTSTNPYMIASDYN